MTLKVLDPPQARFDELELVKPAKSPLSISATFTPLAARAAADTEPLIPPRESARRKYRRQVGRRYCFLGSWLLISLRLLISLKAAHIAQGCSCSS